MFETYQAPTAKDIGKEAIKAVVVTTASTIGIYLGLLAITGVAKVLGKNNTVD